MEADREHTDSLSRFFGVDRVDGIKKKLAEILTGDDYKDFRKEAELWIDTINVPGIAGVIVDRVDDLMITPLAPALKKVYVEADIVDRYLDPDNYDPQETVTVELADHTVKSTHAPHLDIVVNGQKMPLLKLDIKLDLDLKGLILTIRDARIWKIAPGSCKGSGSVTFCGISLLKKESETYELPSMEFADGIPIASRVRRTR